MLAKSSSSVRIANGRHPKRCRDVAGINNGWVRLIAHCPVLVCSHSPDRNAHGRSLPVGKLGRIELAGPGPGEVAAELQAEAVLTLIQRLSRSRRHVGCKYPRLLREGLLPLRPSL